MRIFGATVLAASLLVSNAFAADTLTAGKPAGVKKAQDRPNNMLLVIGGIGLAGVGIGLAASGSGGSPSVSSTATITTSSNTP